MKSMPHCKPDFANAEFVLFVGTAPGQAGNPFKRQGTLVAKARTDGKLSYVVVDPVLTHADNRASGDRGRWLPIKPGTDGALAMAIIRWLFENERIDSHFLSFPNAVRWPSKMANHPSPTPAIWWWSKQSTRANGACCAPPTWALKCRKTCATRRWMLSFASISPGNRFSMTRRPARPRSLSILF